MPPQPEMVVHECSVQSYLCKVVLLVVRGDVVVGVVCGGAVQSLLMLDCSSS